MGTDPVEELFHVSYNRYEILSRITEGTLEKRRIEAQIDASRPTVDRAFRELEDVGILRSEGTTYELTNFGELYCETFSDVVDRFGTLTAVEEVLSYLPRDAPVDMRLLDGAEVSRAKEHAPQEPFEEVVAVARDASEIRGYSSSLLPYYVDVFHSLLVENGVPGTLVLTGDVIETARANYAEKFADVMAADDATIYETPAVRTVGVLVADDTVAVPIGSERDRLQAVVVNDTDAAVAWATDYLDAVVEPDEARLVPAPEG